jgi:hypothetical protein
MEKRGKAAKEREIMGCGKQNCLNAFHTPKKENSYQLIIMHNINYICISLICIMDQM